LLRYDAPFASSQGRFCFVNAGEDFGALAFAFLPQGERFFYRVFLTAKASALDRLADKGHLIGRKLYFHCLHGTGVISSIFT
jgi:hypothetical protein